MDAATGWLLPFSRVRRLWLLLVIADRLAGVVRHVGQVNLELASRHRLALGKELDGFADLRCLSA